MDLDDLDDLDVSRWTLEDNPGWMWYNSRKWEGNCLRNQWCPSKIRSESNRIDKTPKDSIVSKSLWEFNNSLVYDKNEWLNWRGLEDH